VDVALPLIFMAIMGFSLLVYVILDGYDLGIGLLLPLATDHEKDIMIASIGPFWDANETWLVLGVGVLLIGFPSAYAMVLTALYIPVTVMLIGLILRGVAFDFRVKANAKHKQLWNTAFAVGSLIATSAQGWMLGSYVTGLSTGPLNFAFAALIAITMPALYIVLGVGWMMIKCEGELLEKAMRWGRNAMPPMGIALLAISLSTPLVSDTIADRWFSLPNFIGLAPIPITTTVAFFSVYWLLQKKGGGKKLIRLVCHGRNNFDVRNGGVRFGVQPLSLRCSGPIDDMGNCCGNRIVDLCPLGCRFSRAGNRVLHNFRLQRISRQILKAKLWAGGMNADRAGSEANYGSVRLESL
jgi:cytochrome d ubiquinol oxidase subunit II